MLLKSLNDAVCSYVADNHKSGFEKCSLCSLKKKKPFCFPSTSGESFINDESLASVLQNMRYSNGLKSKRKTKKE